MIDEWNYFIKNVKCRGDSEGKSTVYSCRGPGFDFQQPYSG